MNKKQKRIFEQMLEMNPDAMQADGFEDCVAGISVGFKGSCLIYDMRKIINKLKKDEMTEEEAWEYFNFNILGSWVGEFTPVFLAEIYPSPFEQTLLGGLWQRFKLKKK